MVHGKSSIIFVTDSNPQTELFMTHVCDQLDCQIEAVNPHASPDNIDYDKVLVLLDAGHVDEGSMQQWHGRTVENPSVVLAVFNLHDEDHAAEVLNSLSLKGIFYRHDSLKLICKGIGTLLKGEYWMSRSLMARLIESYRAQQINAYRPAWGLTHRELEVTGLLSLGTSNTEIADKLFISEHTVKSHLYNVYRKIKVKNRVQAINWARRNLGAPPPSYQKIRKEG